MKSRLEWTVLTILLLAATLAGADWQEGVAAYQRGDYAAAESHFAAAVESNPDYEGSHYMLGMCRARLGMTGDAVASLEEAVRLAPDNADYTIALGRAYLSDRQPERSFELLEGLQSTEIDESLRGPHALLMASAALRLDRPEQALEILEGQAAVDAADPALQRALGTVYDRLGRRDEAFRAYARTFELDPADPASARAAVRSALAEEDADDQLLAAAADLASSLAGGSPAADDLALAGDACRRAARYAEGAEWYRRALDAEPGQARLLYDRGRCLAADGAADGARDCFELVLALSPEPELARRCHGRLARLAECRLDLNAAARHHRMAGEQERATTMAELAGDHSNALARRNELIGQIGGLGDMVPRLEELGDEQGVEAIQGQVDGLEQELRGIDANLAELRAALAASCDTV